MDADDLPAWEHALALQGLEKISKWWGQRQPLLIAIEQLLGPPPSKPLRLVEVGAGSGDSARWLEHQLQLRGYRAKVIATDLRPAPGVRRLDALRGRLPKADIYYSNLFLHHLPDAALAPLFSRLAGASRIGFAHFDLQRHWAHFYGASALIRLAGLPRINWVDGLRSIQQGYGRTELQAFANAGVKDAKLSWIGPFRWKLTWKRP